MDNSRWSKRRYRLYQIVEVGASSDFPSRFYDFFSTAMLILNLVATFLITFQRLNLACGTGLQVIEQITVAFFAVDCVLRCIAVGAIYPGLSEGRALMKYLLSFNGIVDLLSFVPFYLPISTPTGLAVFRMFRLVRIFRLFRLNAYYDSLNVITEVFKKKRQQLMSSIFIIFVLLMASSMCMYSLEHAAQPDVFKNAFSGLWWAVATLLTIGYGDIYPITVGGQIFSIIMAFLGVLFVAVPTGIISAGFVEQYSLLKQMGEYDPDGEMQFLQTVLDEGGAWDGKKVSELSLPDGLIVVMIHRRGNVVIPRSDEVLRGRDIVVMGAENAHGIPSLEMASILIGKNHKWVGVKIKDLDISRQTFIVMVQRGELNLLPKDELSLQEGDEVILYSRNPQVSIQLSEVK